MPHLLPTVLLLIYRTKYNNSVTRLDKGVWLVLFIFPELCTTMEDPSSLVDSQICPFCECTVRKNCKNEQDLRILTQLRLSVPVKCTMTGKGCNWEGDISQFWDHVLVCEHFPRPCPYECDRNVFMPKKVLHAHLQDKCPMKNIPCEYQWAGCEVVLNRREMSKHMQDAAVLHNQLLAQTAKTYKTQITELQAEIVHLKEEVVVKKDVTGKWFPWQQ